MLSDEQIDRVKMMLKYHRDELLSSYYETPIECEVVAELLSAHDDAARLREALEAARDWMRFVVICGDENSKMIDIALRPAEPGAGEGE